MGVFLTEHPFSRLSLVLPKVIGHGWLGRDSYHYRGDMKRRQQNEPTVQYLVEVRVPLTGYVVDRFTIEQVETGPKAGTTDHPNYNTVQVHLTEKSTKTGLDYAIVRWGDVKDCSAWLAGAPLDD